MAAEAVPFVELLRSAQAAFADAGAATETAGGKPTAEATAYAVHSATTAVEKLALLSRRFSASKEARAVTHGERQSVAPIASDRHFREALGATAEAVAACGSVLGIAGSRIYTTLRNWLSTGEPDCAVMLGSQAETAARILKRKASR